MNLEMTLRMERAMGERDRRLPIPADVAALWRRARDEGVALGALHVLDTPMHPGIAGQHNRESGDIWVLHDPDPDRTVARLIHELAHAARRAVSIPETIEGYYRDEVATQRLARRLARRWGVGDLFPEEVVAAYLLLMRRRRMELPLAGDLAGSHRLGVATAALDDLLRMRHTFGWDDDAWDGVLWGDAAEADAPRRARSRGSTAAPCAIGGASAGAMARVSTRSTRALSWSRPTRPSRATPRGRPRPTG